MTDRHWGGFAVVRVIRAGDKSLSQCDQRLVISTVRRELEHLMLSQVESLLLKLSHVESLQVSPDAEPRLSARCCSESRQWSCWVMLSHFCSSWVMLSHYKSHLRVDSDHVREEEQTLAPGVDGVPRLVDCQDRVQGDGNILVHPISVVSVNTIYIQYFCTNICRTHPLKVIPFHVLSPRWKMIAFP